MQRGTHHHLPTEVLSCFTLCVFYRTSPFSSSRRVQFSAAAQMQSRSRALGLHLAADFSTMRIIGFHLAFRLLATSLVLKLVPAIRTPLLSQEIFWATPMPPSRRASCACE